MYQVTLPNYKFKCQQIDTSTELVSALLYCPGSHCLILSTVSMVFGSERGIQKLLLIVLYLCIAHTHLIENTTITCSYSVTARDGYKA